MNRQGILLGSPVLKSARVREDVARRDQVQARIPLEKSSGSVLRERRIETEHALLAQLHDRVRKDCLAHRTRLKDRFLVYWRLGREVFDAKRAAPQQFRIRDQRHRYTRDGRRLCKDCGEALLQIGDH